MSTNQDQHDHNLLPKTSNHRHTGTLTVTSHRDTVSMVFSARAAIPASSCAAKHALYLALSPSTKRTRSSPQSRSSPVTACVDDHLPAGAVPNLLPFAFSCAFLLAHRQSRVSKKKQETKEQQAAATKLDLQHADRQQDCGAGSAHRRVPRRRQKEG